MRLDVIARLGLAAGGLISLLIVLLVATLDWSEQRQFATPLSIFLYYALPGAVAIGLLGALRLRPPYRVRILMCCVAVALSLYVVEVVAALSYSPHPEPVMVRLTKTGDKPRYAAELARTSRQPIDTRTADEVVADMRKTDATAVKVVTPSNHLFLRQPDGRVTSSIIIDGAEVMPLAPPSSRTTILCNENGPWVQYRADRRGFNNPDAVWQHEHVDVALVGDSFAQGFCVPPDKSFAGLIRRHYPATLNLGVAGDGPLLMLGTLTEYLPLLEPRVVLWCYFAGNDLVDLQIERGSALLQQYLRDDFRQSALQRQRDLDRAIMAEIPRLEAVAHEDAQSSRRSWRSAIEPAIDLAKLSAVRQRLGLIAPTHPREIEMMADFDTPNMEAFREVLQEAKARVEQWNGRLYFLYLPDWERYTTQYRSRGDRRRDEVLSLVRDVGLSIIDIEPVFGSSGDPLSLFPFRGPGHYTETGHGLVAGEVLRRLASIEKSQ